MKFKIRVLLFVVLAVLLFSAISSAQDNTTRLRPPARATGFIGGESHDSYLVHGRKGQRLTVRLSWRRHHDKILGDNNAEFWVGDLPDFDAAGEVKFGNKFDNGKAWTGRLPKTGDYFIYITAHPSARYTLRVTFN
ncbi:MAG TPA: hypothetical protein VGN90_18155 [Pyrinomonadaceae bacterium]|jgi:hypothetical protein|nr:hypothetical protein [Pyrinomonadaceae bacterium]